jgi:sulfite exporter TauE/SafE
MHFLCIGLSGIYHSALHIPEVAVVAKVLGVLFTQSIPANLVQLAALTVLGTLFTWLPCPLRSSDFSGSWEREAL